MRISVKGRYALAAVISMAENFSSGEYTTVISISDKLGISKIYLEQVFSLLRRGGIVHAAKGAQGGYQLTKPPRQISVLEVLAAVEFPLFEPAENTVGKNSPEIENTMQRAVFVRLDDAVHSTLAKLSLNDLLTELEIQQKDQGLMFYI